MEKVAFIGPIDQKGKEAMRQLLGGKFEIVEIPTTDDYWKLTDVNYAILRILTLKKKEIKQAPALKLIQRWGAGYDTVDIRYAGERGILVAVAAGMNAVPVSEYTILLLLGVYRNLILNHKNAVEGKGRDDSLIARSYVIQGKKAGIIGMGNIGRRVAKKLRAFGAEICYYDSVRYPEREQGMCFMELDDLMRECDIISVHIPLFEETRHLIDRTRIASMKPEAVLINTSRGGVVDDEALLEALTENRILGAGLDVFEEEPITASSPYSKLDNVILSAHCAGNTTDNSVTMGNYCATNIIKLSLGESLDEGVIVNGQFLK